MKQIEWPKGSRRFASYSKEELAYVRGFIAQRDHGEITTLEMENQISVLHELKVGFGIDLVRDSVQAPVKHMRAAHEARDEAIRRVDTNADPAWKDKAVRAVKEVAIRQERLISDDVWNHLQWKPIEPRAIGPVMLAAVKLGYIEKVDGEQQQAYRVVNHARPQQVWKSLLFQHEGERMFA